MKPTISLFGTVCASTRNKHGAPGSCMVSNVTRLKMRRATGNPLYLDLARADRPFGEMALRAITERVNLSDQAEGVRKIFEGSYWCDGQRFLLGSPEAAFGPGETVRAHLGAKGGK